MLGTTLFSGGPLSLQPPYPILYPFLCFSHPETAPWKKEPRRFPSENAISCHIPSFNTKSYLSVILAPLPSPARTHARTHTHTYTHTHTHTHPRSEPNKTKKNCFLTFHMSGWCQTLLLDSQKSLLFLCKREVLSRRECFRTLIYLEMTQLFSTLSSLSLAQDRNSGNQNTWRNDCMFSSVQWLSRV